MLSNILIAHDGSDGAFKALTFALDLAHQLQLPLSMLMVEETPDFPASMDEVMEEKREFDFRFKPVAERAKQLAALKQVNLDVQVVSGHPVRTITEFVKEHGVDLLVVGFMGHSALYERIIGGTADRLVRLSPCTVTVVK
jgi:nucleotide-binding universal stress UspA family protein